MLSSPVFRPLSGKKAGNGLVPFARGSVVALALVVLASAVTACKDRNYNAPGLSESTQRSTVLAPAPTPLATVAPESVDNRSAKGGLLASADEFNGTPEHPRFQLKSDYPLKPDFLTSSPPEPNMVVLRGADALAAKRASQEWLEAMQSYIYEDMNSQNTSNANANFRLADTAHESASVSSKRWYHMPWLHTPGALAAKPGRGRDGIWGLTRELDMLTTSEANWPLITSSACMGTNWGIGFFNEPGGYAIGQVFPKGDLTFPEKGVFPKGTVSFKILFTSVTPSALPALEGAWTIEALVNGKGACGKASNSAREITPLRHIQMDVMMKWGDGPSDWIFGNYVFNKARKGDYWQGMEPLGVQFGVKQEQTIVTSPTFSANGFRGRLNGPADNPKASCFSCHARAQWPEPSFALLPFAPRNDADTVNICVLHEWGGEGPGKCRACGASGCLAEGKEPVFPGAVSLDYSLQFGLALRNREHAFSLAKALAGKAN
jgi:hypothetical protein